ncbi:MAG: hypothetical protein R3B68_16320 [Phycisphaerales bacterium]
MKIAAFSWAVVACGVANVACAAIVYVDPPDVTLNWSLTPTGFDLNSDARVDLELLAFAPSNDGRNIAYGPDGGGVRIDPGLGINQLPYAAALEPGTPIDASGPWQRVATLGFYPEFGPHTGHWISTGPRMLALRFPSADGEHFGWVRVSADPWQIVLHDFGYESEAGAPITAGAVPGPGGAGVLVAVSVLGGARRRRRG